MTSTGKKSRSTVWKDQTSVYKLDNITSSSGFKLSRPITSCAECKRLKIKCLKNESAQVGQSESTSRLQTRMTFPCLTCIRRGCEAICSERQHNHPLLHITDLTPTHLGPLPQGALGPTATGLKHHQPVTLHTQTQILECQNRITALKKRVRELENALQDTHAKLSDDTHPLLRFDVNNDWSYDSNKRDDESKRQENQSPSKAQDQSKEEDSIVEAFGSLSIKEDGRSTYHAQNAGAWYYLQVDDEGTSPDLQSDTAHLSTNTNESQNGISGETREPISLSAILTPDILYASRMFPVGAIDDVNISSEILVRIENYLPTREEALRLVDNYYANSSWLYDPISRSHFMSDIFDIVYPPRAIPESRSQYSWPSSQSQSPSDDPDFSSPRSRHCSLLSYPLTLAMFFITLAIGTHLDLDQQGGSPSTNVYYHLARAAVASDRVSNTKSTPNSVDGTGMSACLLEPGLDIIRVLLLMCFYLHMSDGRAGYSASWALMGLVTKLANGSFPSGRPPSFLRMGIDLKRPYEYLLEKYRHHLQSENQQDETDPRVEIDKPENDNILDIFKAWKHYFCFMKLGPTVEQAWGARIPSYYTVLVLDRVLREDLENTPVLLRLPPESVTQGAATSDAGPQLPSSTPPNLDPQTMTSLTMQRYTLLFMTHVALVLMHRPYFVQALNISDQPLMTKFAASVLAVYRSSCTLVTRGIELYALEPRLSPRLWYFWSQMFSSVTCLGDLVVRSPNLSLAPSALAHIELACDLFKRVNDSNRTTRALKDHEQPTMLKLRDKARLVLDTYQTQSAQRFKDCNSERKTDQNKGPIPVPTLGERDEFSALVGQTRLVDLRTIGSDTKLCYHSNVQSLASRRHLHLPTMIPASYMASSAVSVFAPLSAVGVTGSGPTDMSTSANPGHVPGIDMSGVPTATNEFNTEFKESMTSSGHNDQFQTLFGAQVAQLVDPFVLFRQLGLDLTPSPSNTFGGNGIDMDMRPYANTDAPRIEPHWQLGYDSTKSQFLGDTQAVPGDALAGTETLQGQQVDFMTGVDINIVQPQDTDTAFENFITQAMKGYTSRSALRVGSSPSGSSDLNNNSNSNLNLETWQSSTSNFDVPHDSLGPSSWNQTFDMMNPDSQNTQDQRFRNSGPGSAGGQSLLTYPDQSSFITNVSPQVESFYGLNTRMMSMENSGNGAENEAFNYNIFY